MYEYPTRVSEVQIIPIKPVDGLVAFASCVIDSKLFVGSLGVHKLLDGTGYRITYPTKKLASRQINYYHPITRDAAVAIEEAVAAKCVELFKRSDEHYGRYSQTTSSHT